MAASRVAAVGLLVIAHATLTHAAGTPTPQPTLPACEITITDTDDETYTGEEAFKLINTRLRTIQEIQDDYHFKDNDHSRGSGSVNMTKYYTEKAYKNVHKFHSIMLVVNQTRADVEDVLVIVDDYKTQVNTICVICGAMLIILGRVGFMIRHIGMVTAKSMKCSVVHEMLGISVAVIGWWATGYGVAFGADNFPKTEINGLIGWDGFFGDLGTADTSAKALKMAFFVLQLAYCMIAVAIPIGSIQERGTVTFAVIMSLMVSMITYPLLVHVIWSEEGMFSAYREEEAMLFDCGTLDFAGSGVIHLCGGCVALAAAVIVGPRKGRWITSDDQIKPILQPKPQSSPAFEAFGGCLLFCCSIANTGFATREFVEDSVVAGKAMSNTLIAAGVASFASVLIGHFYTGIVSPQLSCGGALAGIAAISAGCASVDVEGAVVIGFCAAWAYYVGGCLMLKLHIDDVSHAISIHGFAGGFGLIAAGLFTTKESYAMAYTDNRDDACYGIFYNGGIGQLAAQAMAVGFIIGWTLFTSFIILGSVHLTMGSRYPLQWEENGVDYHKFGGECAFAHVAVQHDRNRFAHGILTDTDYGVPVEDVALAEDE